MDNMKLIHMVAFALVIVGALNWGLVGLFDYNLVKALLGNMPSVEKVVYILVGAAALVCLALHLGNDRRCW